METPVFVTEKGRRSVERVILSCDVCGREATEHERFNHNFLKVYALTGEKVVRVPPQNVPARMDVCPGCFEERFAPCFALNKHGVSQPLP